MKNLQVAKKLTVSFLIVVVLAAAVGLVGIFGMASINSADDALYHENVVAISAMGAIRENLQDQVVQMRNKALNAGDSAAIQQYKDDISTMERNMETLFSTSLKTPVGKPSARRFQSYPPILDFIRFPNECSGFLKNVVPCLGSLVKIRYFMDFCKID